VVGAEGVSGGGRQQAVLEIGSVGRMGQVAAGGIEELVSEADDEQDDHYYEGGQCGSVSAEARGY